MLGTLVTAGAGYAMLYRHAPDPLARGRVVVDYWEKWTGQEAQAMQRVVDRFNRSQDQIFVRYFTMSAIDQKALVAIAGGDPPDVIGLWNFSLPAFVESRALTPIDELIEAFGEETARRLHDRLGTDDARIEQSRYAEAIWATMHHEGQLGGVVNTCSTLALYYDRAAFREVGLDPDAPPTTIDQLDEAAERLTTLDAKGKVERAGFLHREPGWWNWIWGFCFGGRLYDPIARRATTTDPANVAAYKWLQTYPDRYGSSRLTQFQSGFGGYNSTQQPLLAGKVAMSLHGPFLANVIETFAPEFDYGATPFPVEASLLDPARPIALLEADVLCVPKGAKHPGEAFEFIAFTQRQSEAESLARAHAKPSPLVDSGEAFFAGHPNRYAAMHTDLVRSERAFPKPPTRVWPQYEAEFNSTIDALWELRVTPEEALETIRVRAQQAIDLAETKRTRRYGPRVEGSA